MTQPSYVPIVDVDQVRPAYRLRTPTDWRTARVAEIALPGHPKGRELGVPGPDQGYVLLLGQRLFESRLVLAPGIGAEDALVGCAQVASARAALFGRAPVAKDLELALELFGFLGEAPADLVEWRRGLFVAAAHHYGQQRRIADAVPEDTLRLTPAQVRAQRSAWRTLVDTSVTA
ncbi:MAG TPA: hypothetical protein VK386_07520 [Acidimicrobiales bacterium]|nr:hypothetical protein [Acidimicrobiales bacterium]